jgi:hypothetical protein
VFIPCRAAKNEPRKRAKGFPLDPKYAQKLSAPAPPMFLRSVANSDFAFAFGSPNANTGESRNKPKQTILPPAMHPVIEEISNRTGKQKISAPLL